MSFQSEAFKLIKAISKKKGIKPKIEYTKMRGAWHSDIIENISIEIADSMGDRVRISYHGENASDYRGFSVSVFINGDYSTYEEDVDRRVFNAVFELHREKEMEREKRAKNEFDRKLHLAQQSVGIDYRAAAEEVEIELNTAQKIIESQKLAIHFKWFSFFCVFCVFSAWAFL